MEIQIFDDSLTEDLPVYWHGNEYYPATVLTDEDRGKIKQVACARFHYKGAGPIGADYEKVFDQLYRQLYQLIFSDEDDYNKYIIYLDRVLAPNRIRSFKGVLKKKYQNDPSILEIEEPFKENRTIMAAAICLSKENFYKYIYLIDYSPQRFLICTKENYFHTSFIQEVIEKYRDREEHGSIKYLELITAHCLKNDRIYRIGGDGADYWLTLECYFKK